MLFRYPIYHYTKNTVENFCCCPSRKLPIAIFLKSKAEGNLIGGLRQKAPNPPYICTYQVVPMVLELSFVPMLRGELFLKTGPALQPIAGILNINRPTTQKLKIASN